MAPSKVNLNRAIRALLRDVSRRMEEFSHIQPSRILVVAGEARRASRGTVKPLAFPGGKRLHASGLRKPTVRIEGRRMLYCITLRPLFFRDSTPEARVETLLHELFHISPAFDGTLDEGRRHAALGPTFQRRFRPLLRRYLRECPESLLAPFARNGEVRMLQWLERPPTYALPEERPPRREYTETHLFTATLRMVTRRGPA